MGADADRASAPTAVLSGGGGGRRDAPGVVAAGPIQTGHPQSVYTQSGFGSNPTDRLATFHPDVIVLNVAWAPQQPDLVQQLRSACPGVRVLDASPPHAAERVIPPADAVIGPPLRARALIDAIWRLVEQRADPDAG